MKKIILIITLLMIVIFSLLILITKNEQSILNKYKEEDVRIKFYTNNEIILNEISDFLTNNPNIEEITQSKSCYQNNCQQIKDYIVIGNYDGELDDIIDKMSQLNLYSAMKVIDINNEDVLYNYFSLYSTHRYFIGYKKCISDSCSSKDNYYERIINKNTYYYKEKQINNEWSTIFTDIPSL